MRAQITNDAICNICSTTGLVGHVDKDNMIWTEPTLLGRVDPTTGKVYNIHNTEIGYVEEKGVIIKNGDVVAIVDPYKEIWARGIRIGRAIEQNTNLRIVGGAALLLLLR